MRGPFFTEAMVARFLALAIFFAFVLVLVCIFCPR
jgi:hypothetical protein